MGEFVHLHLHTEYSLLDGAAKISQLADKAISEGQDAIAITDHGAMYGVVEFYNALKEKGVKAIIGCEVYVAPRSRLLKEGKQDSSGNHLILLCKNEVGYRNLCYMVSKSFIDGFYMRPRIDMELLQAHHEGLIALSACIAGRIPQLILSGSMSEAEKYALEMKSLFGEDFYLEIQNHGLDDERRVAYGIKLLSEKLGIDMVCTNDVHYIEKNDADMQSTLMCIQTNNVITDGRPFGFETDEFYFKSTAEMKALFSTFKGAVENTVKIAEKCNFDFEFDKIHLPNFTSDDGLTHKDKLRQNTFLGFENLEKHGRFNYTKHKKEEYLERIEYELSVIDTMGFNAYFLIVSDFVNYAKSKNIPVGPGRGSGAGSLVAFCVGITDVDPMAYDLLFERFLNPERVSMPDFDIDFCYTRRDEVIDYVKEKYGEDKVAQIVTFGTLAARAAIKDVGRALGMPYGRVDTVSKLVPRELNITIDSALHSKELRALYESEPDIKRLIDISRSLEGMPRHASTHAAGVVITEKPTYEYVPLSYSGTGVVTQFDMNTDAKLGLVKFDFLGLRYITVIHDAEEAIKRRFPSFDISKIPLDDRETFKLLCEARTDGVFQLESGGMKQVLSRLVPSNLEDIIACIALYRPGPMDSIDKFIARKHGNEVVEYKIPQLKQILDVTYGCIVYQEQVMQICRLLAGYSYARADIVRRAMSKKKEDAMKAERQSFIDGCRKNGVGEKAAVDIFEEMVGFAKYAFNKSHATAYGIISYRTAYLKAHYPAEYMSALLTSVLDQTAKLRSYVADAQRHGVSVLEPDINYSNEDFAVTSDGNIRFGLLAIKNVGRNFAKAVIEKRKNSPYKSLDDFISRLIDSDLNKRTLESLVKCGVFDNLGTHRAALISSYEGLLNSEHERTRKNLVGQLDLFSLDESSHSDVAFQYPEVEPYSLKELLILEKESSGMYFSGHMIDNYKKHVDFLDTDSVKDIIEDTSEETMPENPRYKEKSRVAVAGIITAKKTKTIKNGDTMAFLLIDDGVAEIEVIVFARYYTQFSAEIYEENGVLIEGNISIDEGEGAKILLSSLKPLKSNKDFEISSDAQRPQRLYIKVESTADKKIANLQRISILNSGETEIVIYDNLTKKYSIFKDSRIKTTDSVLDKLKLLFGENNVILK